MKKYLSVIFFYLISSTFCHAQTPILWGYTLNGGINSYGILLNYNVSSNTETDVYDFPSNPSDGQNPLISFVRANNGLLYGVTLEGGTYSKGTIFSYNISTAVEMDLHNFGSGTDGQAPHGFLIQANNSLLYGMTQNGGISSKGILYSYNISTGIETDLHDFSGGADGNSPNGSLVQASNGLIYGVVGGGGLYSGGTMFSYDITNGNYIVLHEFGSDSDGYNPQGSLIQAGDSILYGMTIAGGKYDIKLGGDGVIFSYNIKTGIETVVHNFGNGTDGKRPIFGKLLQFNDSLLYGLTSNGGSNDTATNDGDGTIFSYNILTGKEIVLHSFGSGSDGTQPLASLTKASNGLLYGMTSTGGIYGSIPGDGIIFSYDITTGTETDIHDFGNSKDGRNPWGSLIEVDTATIYVAPAVICVGGSILLTASGAITYAWSPTTGLSATTGDSVIASPTVTTTYTITGMGAIPTYPTTVVVTVNAVPVVLVNTPPPVCSGTGAMLTASGAAAYTWAPIKNLSSATGSSVTATPTATTTYTVIGTSGGCADTTTTVVTVKPNPVLNVPAPPTICNGSAATLTASGAATYTWSPNTALSATTGDTITANPATTTTYTVAGLAANGCADTTTVTVTVNPGVVLAVNTPQPKCSGNTDTLTVSGATTYTWSPTTGLSATTGSTVTAKPIVTTTYTITGTSSGCPGTTMVTVAIDSVPALIINAPESICTGTNAGLTASGATSYTWFPSTGLNATTGSSVTAAPTATTTYLVTGANSFGCSTTDTDIVTVIPAPNKPTITVSLTGDSLISSATTDNQWYFNSQPITDSTAEVLIVKGHQKGWFTVTVTNPANGCSTTSDSVYVDPTGINQLSVNSEQLSIYPNPGSGLFTVSSSKIIDDIKVTNVLGQLIYEAYPKQGQFNFNLITGGLYFVTITTDDEMVTKNVLVIK